MDIIIYHETSPKYVNSIMNYGFSVSHQNDYPNHAFFYIKDHEIVPNNNKGAKIAVTMPEAVVNKYFIFKEGFDNNHHIPLAIPFDIVNKYIHTFRVI